VATPLAASEEPKAATFQLAHVDSVKATPEGKTAQANLLVLEPTESVTRDTPTLRVWQAYVLAWSQTVRGTRPPVLDDKRKKLIATRLKTFAECDLIAACEGVFKSDWHVRERQTSIELVLRDSAHIENFMAANSGEARPPARQSTNRKIIQRDDWQ
jgi:hypothetical protein